jgi:hypothetical protein
LAGYPLARQTNASAGPVLPPVYSTTVVPGSSRPSRSAPSIIASAMRSFIDPVGLRYSSFTQISAPSGGIRCNRTSGVLPIASTIPVGATGRAYSRALSRRILAHEASSVARPMRPLCAARSNDV